MKPLLIITLVWVVVVALFALGGYYGADTEYSRNRGDPPREYERVCALLAGSFGLGLSTCGALDLLIVVHVARGHLKRAWAILLLALSSVGSAMLYYASIIFGTRVFSLQFRGKEPLGVVFLWFITVIAVICAFVMFSVCAAFMAPPANAAHRTTTA